MSMRTAPKYKQALWALLYDIVWRPTRWLLKKLSFKYGKAIVLVGNMYIESKAWPNSILGKQR